MISFLTRRYALCAGAYLLALTAAAAEEEASKACTPISTVQQLQNIRFNLGGNYCLTKNLNATNFAGFKPIGDNAHPLTNPFHGTFDGRGHTISNLKIFKGIPANGSPVAAEVGLFMTIGQKVVNGKLRIGQVRNLKLLNVDARWTGVSSAWVGGLAGAMRGKALVTNVDVTGSVRGGTYSPIIGGMIGEKLGGTLSKCLTNVKVIAGDSATAGGMLGRQVSGVTRECAARGPVTVGDGSQAAGFVGVNINDSQIIESSSIGAVKAGDSSDAAGFTTLNDGVLTQVFSHSPVTVGGGFGVSLAALVTFVTEESKIRQSYATGKVMTTATFPTNIGGLIGFGEGIDDEVTSSYWDTQSTGQAESDGGTPRTTAQLKGGGLPPGFSPTIWGKKANRYPHLKKIPEN